MFNFTLLNGSALDCNTVDITGVPKEAVLMALYNVAKPQGLGFMHYRNENMTMEEAKAIVDSCLDFDYLMGRVMKVNLSKDLLNVYLFNRDNGPNAAQNALEKIIKSSGE
ncbi:MAG: hypothetical protein CNLJKLNK_00899 [Holosporales bacterium]